MRATIPLMNCANRLPNWGGGPAGRAAPPVSPEEDEDEDEDADDADAGDPAGALPCAMLPMSCANMVPSCGGKPVPAAAGPADSVDAPCDPPLPASCRALFGAGGLC